MRPACERPDRGCYVGALNAFLIAAATGLALTENYENISTSGTGLVLKTGGQVLICALPKCWSVPIRSQAEQRGEAGATVAGVARPLRLQVPDGVYHVTARGNERRPIYRDATDRRRFLEILAGTLERFRWRCLGYCLMTNHYHLLVHTLEPNLSRGMRDLNGVYAQFFNRRHGRVGHLFQGRYRGILIERDEHLLAVVAYIVRNPVRACLCETPAEWSWSSHAAALGERPPGLLALEELLAYFGPSRARARECYRELTESTAWDDSAARPEGVVLGSEEFVRVQLRNVGPSTEIPERHRRVPAPPLLEIFSDCDGSDPIARAYEHGYTMPVIARHLGLHPSTISRRLARRRAQIKT